MLPWCEAAWLIFATAWLHAERLPIRTYSSADGLPSGTTNCIVRDSRGFLWLCTYDGLIRFDGESFKTFGLEAGIPNRAVTVFLQAKRSGYWTGTLNGLARFDPDAPKHGRLPFVAESIPGGENAQHVTALVEGPDGTVWCGTRGGLFRIPEGKPVERVDLGLPEAEWVKSIVRALVVDRHGSLWIGIGSNGLLRRSVSGKVDRLANAGLIYSLMLDRHGRVWAAAGGAIQVFEPLEPGGSGITVHRMFHMNDGLPNDRPKALIETGDGSVWAGTENGIAVLTPDSLRFRSYGKRHGLADVQVHALGEDADGNLWIGGESFLMRLARSGMVTFDTADGLGGNSIVSIMTGKSDGQTYFVSGFRRITISRFDGGSLHAVVPRVERKGKPISYMGWAYTHTVVQDSTGDWWIPTGEGLCRFSQVHRFEELGARPPSVVYTIRDGLPGNDIFRVFEDSRGTVWVSTVDVPGLSRWDQHTRKFVRAGEEEGFVTPNQPAAFVEDSAGDLWVGMYWKGVARRRRGKWHMFGPDEGAPRNTVWSMLSDRRGRIWIASGGDGVGRIDEPASEHPRIRRYSTRDGLSSDVTTSLVEDQAGIIYIAGARGIDALDPESGRIRHFDSADGLAGGDVFASLCDRAGVVWFGATHGVSRLLPAARQTQAPRSVRIMDLRIAGVPVPLPATGEQTISGLTLDPDQNHLDLEVGSIEFGTRANMGYQYRLDPRAPWSRTFSGPHISLVGLGPGSYHLAVRAVREGVPGAEEAQFHFRVLPPIWRRWWSIFLAGWLAASLLYAAHRYRMSYQIRSERMRARIAMDLHDDVGSTLSYLSILSEIARRQTNNGAASESLGRLAQISRELVASMGDIVWAVNPQRDHGADLVQRMRRFGEDLLGACQITFDCTATADVQDAPIPADVRREIYLIFKEAMNNIARHSGCRNALAHLSMGPSELRLEVCDDGAGFHRSDAERGDGHGLSTMKARAERIGGRVSVVSDTGSGTTLLLRVPLRRYLFR